MLETSECISIKNKGRNYTDCMEFSLLRFIQMLLFDINELTKNEYSTYPSNILNKELLEFIKKYPKIYQKVDKYNNTLERQDWSIFLSDKKEFDYYRNDKAELFTNVRNILLVLNKLFNISIDNLIDNKTEYNNVFTKIGNMFSTDNKKINIKIIKSDILIETMSMHNIKLYLSRPDSEYEQLNPDSIYKVINKNTLIKIKINNITYKWKLYELYIDDNSFDNNYITGHSVIQRLKHTF